MLVVGEQSIVLEEHQTCIAFTWAAPLFILFPSTLLQYINAELITEHVKSSLL